VSEDRGSPYKDDALVVENGVPPEEVQDFVLGRASNPEHVAGMTIWNFNNHQINEEQLERQADDLYYDEYLIPYSIPGAWGYMVSLLPEVIREVEILVYSQDRDQYNPYPNYFRHTSEGENNDIRDRIATKI
jgi:hypothetical protein